MINNNATIYVNLQIFSESESVDTLFQNLFHYAITTTTIRIYHSICIHNCVLITYIMDTSTSTYSYEYVLVRRTSAGVFTSLDID